MMRLRALVCAVAATAAVSGCELRERDPGTDGPALDTVRASPTAADTSVSDLGPVFAPAEAEPLVVGDDFWAGPGTVGYELVGRFQSEDALRASLDPAIPVGPADDRVWRLGDILVAVDFRGEGPTATWRVAGPAPVVEAYVQRLGEGAAERSPLRDLGVLPLDVRYCCGSAPGGSRPGTTSGPDR